MHKLCQMAAFAVLLGAIALVSPVEPASGQASPTLPGIGVRPIPGSVFPSPNDMLRHHMSPTGKPCLTIGGYAQAQTINNHIFEHWIGAANACGKNIKVQICYHGTTQDCIMMDVPPYGRKDSVLGIYPATTDFRYDAKEQF